MARFTADAGAVIVFNTTGNTSAPPDDPGWNNVTETGASVIYLGDSWVLTARHVRLTTPPTVQLAAGEFEPIPNSEVTLPNPSGLGLSTSSDLWLYRINGNPDLPTLKIAQSPPPVNALVTMMGIGTDRQTPMFQWDVDDSGDDWTWNQVTSGGNYRGFKANTNQTRTKRWGTNRIASDESVEGEGDSDNTAPVKVNGRDTVSLFTTFEANGSQYEAQAQGGDSGGAVFYKRGGEWELIGIMNAILTYPDQHPAWAVYGNATSFADLSTYRPLIEGIMANTDYSILGDINLDGVVSGNGTGPAESDDVKAFIQGWRYTQASPNIDSWKKGDLNQDATTNFADFLLLREALGVDLALGDLIGGTVPEPSTGLLAVLLAALGALPFRGRRRSV